ATLQRGHGDAERVREVGDLDVFRDPRGGLADQGPRRLRDPAAQSLVDGGHEGVDESRLEQLGHELPGAGIAREAYFGRAGFPQAVQIPPVRVAPYENRGEREAL